MEQKNTFNGGMDRDMSSSFKIGNRYTFMENGDVVSNESNSTGIITNVKGNKELDIIWASDVDINVSPYDKDAKNPYSTSWKIIGSIYLRDDIILFYTDILTQGYSIIDLLKYNGDTTYTRIRLVYNAVLGFEKQNKIHGIARFENESVIKCYFAEKNKNGNPVNSIRSFNLAPDIVDKKVSNSFLQSSYTRVNNLTKERFNILKNTKMYPPSFASYGNGVLRYGVVQYSHRELYKNGSIGAWSPLSETIPIIKGNPEQKFSGSGNIVGGDTVGNNIISDKSVKISFTYNDCDYIEIARFWYSSINEIPEIYLIERIKTKKGGGFYTFEDNVYESNYGVVDILEFTELPLLFKAKTLINKDNRLFAGNIEMDFFDVDFDARAYRFNPVGIATIEDSIEGLININGTAPDWNIIEHHDAINITNDINNDFMLEGILDHVDVSNSVVGNSSLSMIQGKYVGYLFVNITRGETKTILQNTQTLFTLTSFSGWLSTDKYCLRPDFRFQSDGTTPGAEGANIKISYKTIKTIIDLIAARSITAPFDDFISGRYKTFQKDEIYRFGLVIYDNYGRKSPVKWICDLRMPSIEHTGLVSLAGLFIEANNTIPIFEVNLIGTEAEGMDYQIVYVKRESKDRTIIAQGTINGTFLYDDVIYSPISMSESNKIFNVGLDLENGSLKYLNNTSIYEFNSPELAFNKTAKLTGARIDYLGYFEGTNAHNIYKDELNNDSFAGVVNHAVSGGSNWVTPSLCGKVNNFVPVYRTTQSIIDDGVILKPNQVTIVNGIVVSGQAFYDAAAHPGYKGVKSTCAFLSYGSKLEIAHTVNIYRIGLVNIRDFVIQYNGNTYEDRLSNNYIMASEIGSSGTVSLSANYGDTFLQMYDMQRVMWRNKTERDSESYLNSCESFLFPLESSINLALRLDDFFTSVYKLNINPYEQYASQVREGGVLLAERYDSTTFLLGDPVPGAYDAVVNFSELFLYNSVYSRVSDIVVLVPVIDLFNNNKLDSTIVYSDFKINGELTDNWLKFRINNANEADTIYGAINYMLNKNNTVIVFQDSGISIAQINPQIQITQSNKSSLILGTGGVLDRFNYINNTIGIQKINEAIESNSGIYWLDINKKKIYSMYGTSIQSLSDTRNMYSYFADVINDNTEFIGVYDNKRGAIFMTLRNEIAGTLFDDVYFSCIQGGTNMIIEGDTSKVNMQGGLLYSLVRDDGSIGYYYLDTVNITNILMTYYSGVQFSIGDIVDLRKYIDNRNSFTIVFSEKGNYFVSLESFTPSLYLKGVREFYTTDNDIKLYQHNTGDRGSYYGVTYPLIIEFIVNGLGNVNKILGAFEIMSEVLFNNKDSENDYDFIGVENETFNEIRVTGNGRQSEFIDIYLKNGSTDKEIVGDKSTGNISPLVYISSERVLQDTNGIKLIPYPEHLYNGRKTLNKTRILSPRIKIGRTDINGKEITENIRGNYFSVRLIFNNNSNKLFKLYEVISYINTSIEI